MTDALRRDLEARWSSALEAGRNDPFTNAYLRFALEMLNRFETGEVEIDGLEAVVRSLGADGFLDRAARLGAYLGPADPSHNRQALETLFEGLAKQGFEHFANRVGKPTAGVVTTAHPTFALAEDLSLVLVELATGYGADGERLDEPARARREALVRDTPLGPPPQISLDLEHAWSLRALTNAVDALDQARAAALAVARRHWPDRWTQLSPRLMTLATWVGFDQDGRTDVTWSVSLAKRLDLKRVALQRYRALAAGVPGADIAARLDAAIDVTARQAHALAEAGDDPVRLAAFSRLLVAGGEAALSDPTPLLADIGRALEAAPDDDLRQALVILRANVETQGVCLAHIHVRLNAAQLHNAIRHEIDLETSPSDPANRRSYFQAVNDLIGTCRPVEIGIQSLLAEPASAKRLFMTIAQMAKYVDAASPVRFLIAETESGFTLLTALYFARLFGVEHLVELSPLYETEEGLDRGEAVLTEALKSPHYRAYLRAQGKVAVEFGFSDSGRFIGQMAATFRIERLRLRLAELMAREELCDLELILFNTHGESIGRGGHPHTLLDRLAYTAPPRDRREFAERGIHVREEDSFQGGEGYLPFFTLVAAQATVRGILHFALTHFAEEADDPIYAAPDFAVEFFATVQQAFSTLAKESDYATLLGLFGVRMLNRTGSRPVQRQNADTGGLHTFTHVSELRAIPNNGILQGLGNMANVTFGVARGAAKAVDLFDHMRQRSARFGRALRMVETAAELSDLQATRAYAATMNPTLWLDQGDAAAHPPTTLLERLTRLSERAGLIGRLSNTLRQLRGEAQMPFPVTGSPRRGRLQLLHAIRIALIQQIAVLAARIPPFTPRANLTLEDVQLQLIRLDVDVALSALAEIFPALPAPVAPDEDFGETPTYVASDKQGYAHEHAVLFEPIGRLQALILQITCALDQEIGACG